MVRITDKSWSDSKQEIEIFILETATSTRRQVFPPLKWKIIRGLLLGYGGHCVKPTTHLRLM